MDLHTPISLFSLDDINYELDATNYLDLCFNKLENILYNEDINTINNKPIENRINDEEFNILHAKQIGRVHIINRDINLRNSLVNNTNINIENNTSTTNQEDTELDILYWRNKYPQFRIVGKSLINKNESNSNSLNVSPIPELRSIIIESNEQLNKLHIPDYDYLNLQGISIPLINNPENIMYNEDNEIIEEVIECNGEYSSTISINYNHDSTFKSKSTDFIDEIKIDAMIHDVWSNYIFDILQPLFQSYLIYKSSKVFRKICSNLFSISKWCNILSIRKESTTSATSHIKIYTKTGDKGTTSLYTGERRSKTDEIFEALGNTDELNSNLGISKEYCKIDSNGVDEYIEQIQSRLLDIGSHIATPLDKASDIKIKRAYFDPSHTADLEKWIDTMEKDLPELKNFILPGGGMSASSLHVCRTIARRAERSVVALYEKEMISIDVVKYINRLSDFCFMAARYSSHFVKETEVVYQKAKLPPSINESDSNNDNNKKD